MIFRFKKEAKVIKLENFAYPGAVVEINRIIYEITDIKYDTAYGFKIDDSGQKIYNLFSLSSVEHHVSTGTLKFINNA